MIPEAAVEAAAIAWSGPREWYAHSDEWRDDRREDARSALEAAAPHMLAEAWEAGWKASSDWSIYIDMGGDEPECDNPYRSQE